jgi:hypothetical protein
LEDLFQWLRAFANGLLDRPRTKLHRAFAQQRHSDDDVEARCVAMPSNGSSGRIICHEDFRKLIGVALSELSEALSQRREKLRDRRRRTKSSGLVFVAASEMNDTPFRDNIAHFNFAKLKTLDRPNECLFFVVRDQVGFVYEALGQLSGVCE